ncbi:MAG: helix-turn-helix transcriptional regulator [Chloroflexaceae bacterium]|nr:helix-turn-helix transcriptional regulator [Chloroflexaceae bacterium]NJO07670.1 helix-turn-helix transcriptional regulator [Chloroflexaceae bacterium]
MQERQQISDVDHDRSLSPDGIRLMQSSDGLGWEGFVVRTYEEPAAMELWRVPDTTALTLILVVRGVLHMEQRRLDGPWTNYVVRTGDLFLRPPGRAPYELRWTASEPTRTVHIHIDRSLVLRTAASLYRGDPSQIEVIEQVGLQDALLTQLGLHLGAALEHATPADGIYAQSALQLLVTHLIRYHAATRNDTSDPTGGLTRQQLQRVVEFAQAHLDQAITLEALAQQTGYSPYHFARLFRQSVGMSPYQFVLRQRLERAQQLLHETEHPLLEIARDCGFANQSHMTRIFRQQLGTTPRAYRRLRENIAGM